MAPRKQPKELSETEKLVKAIEFLAVAQQDPEKNKDLGLTYQAHMMLQRSTAVAFNGVLAAGTFVDLGDVVAAPQTFKLLTALKRCKAQYSVTQLENGAGLVVRSGAFRVTIDAMPLQDLATLNVYPDNPTVAVDDRLKTAFSLLNPLLQENTAYVVTSSLLLTNGVVKATDRALLVEYWHGLTLSPVPVAMVIPKTAVTAVAKCPKPLTSIGFSNTSVTFWFADNSWIKSQLHTEPYPNTDGIFNFAPVIKELPKKLKEALEAVSPFSPDGAVYLNENEVASHLDNAKGATHDCKGLDGGWKFNVKRLSDVLNFATHADWTSSTLGVYFQGDNVRAMLAKVAG